MLNWGLRCREVEKDHKREAEREEVNDEEMESDVGRGGWWWWGGKKKNDKVLI